MRLSLGPRKHSQSHCKYRAQQIKKKKKLFNTQQFLNYLIMHEN